MGRQIIKREDGRWALWSSVVDGFIADECTDDEIVQLFMDEATRNVERNCRTIMQKLRDGKKAYHQFTMTYDECVRRKEELRVER